MLLFHHHSHLLLQWWWCFLALMLVILTPSAVSFPKFYGEWMLWHSTVPDLPDNRVVVHIYPDNQLTLKYRFLRGPVVYHKSKIGTYKLFPPTGKEGEEDEKRTVEVLFHHTEEMFLSVYGIGLQNFNIKTKKTMKQNKFDFSMTMAGMDDIYLQSMARNDDCFHMVRSVRINEPPVDIPLSTFLITQIVGTLLGHVINQVLFHTDG